MAAKLFCLILKQDYFAMRNSAALIVGLGTLFAFSSANAGFISDPTSGNENAVTYTFAAVSTGDLTAYFAGSGASYDETLGVLINGVASSVTGLDNHTTAYGTSLSFGNVTAGDILTFYLDVITTDHLYYSNVAFNADAVNHVYSTGFTTDGIIPSGTYVGFEDLSPVFDGFSDFNYTDEQFVFTNTSTTISSVPLPASAPLFGAALLLFGMVGYGMKKTTKTAN